MEKVGKKVALYARVSEEAKGKLDALAESAGVDKDDVLEHAIELASVAGPAALKERAGQQAKAKDDATLGELDAALEADGGY